MDCKTDEGAIMAALVSLSSACNVAMSTVPSRNPINSDAKVLGCDVFMQSLLSELYSIMDSISIFFVHVCLLSNIIFKLSNSWSSIIAFPLDPQK